MFAGQTLAQIADAITLDPSLTPLARAELQARVARQGKSAANAAKALARMDAGETPALPAKAPKPASERTSARPATGVDSARKALAAQRAKRTTERATSAHTRTANAVSERDFFAHVANVGRANGYSIPRWIAAGAKGRNITPKA